MNARAVDAVGGGTVIEESDATPQRLLSEVRRLLMNEPLRRAMGSRMRRLHAADATERLADTIFDVAHAPRRRAPHAQASFPVNASAIRAAALAHTHER